MNLFGWLRRKAPRGGIEAATPPSGDAGLEIVASTEELDAALAALDDVLQTIPESASWARPVREEYCILVRERDGLMDSKDGQESSAAGVGSLLARVDQQALELDRAWGQAHPGAQHVTGEGQHR